MGFVTAWLTEWFAYDEQVRAAFGLSPQERIAVPCIGRERSDLVVAGCAILETIFEIWPAQRLGIADRGIREGILRSLMAAGGEAERSREALRNLRRGASA